MQSDTQRHTEITSYRLDNLYRYCSELFAVRPVPAAETFVRLSLNC